jgi:hypothetical protein
VCGLQIVLIGSWETDFVMPSCTKDQGGQGSLEAGIIIWDGTCCWNYHQLTKLYPYLIL